MLNKCFYYPSQILLILLIKSFFIVLLILFAGLGLGPDEAQYWTWSKALDFGYYSKPPAIAWQIGLGTFLLGDNELGVRFIAVIIAFAQAFVNYLLALQCGLQRITSFWCGIIMALCPIGIFGSFFAITDGGLLLFWTVACLVVVQAFRQSKVPNAFSLGCCILMGALFKWSIYIFWIYVFFSYCLFFPFKKWYMQFFLGILISLLGLLPSVWWNWSHEWATFRHVASTLQGGHGSTGGNFFEFIGSQALLLSPIFFVLLTCAYSYCFKYFKNLNLPLRFCFIISCGNLLFFLGVSLFQKMQGNWILFAYPTAITLIAWYCCEVQIKAFKWMRFGLIFTLILTGVVFLWPSYTFYYNKSPFKHNLGWNNLNHALKSLGYNPNEHFLVSDKYQTTSILSFYSPGQKRAYFLNLEGNRKNQFSYWPDLQTLEKEKTGYFIWVENTPHLEKNWQERRDHYLDELKKYFEEVGSSELIPIILEKGQIIKGALIFKCKDCKGNRPIDSIKY